MKTKLASIALLSLLFTYPSSSQDDGWVSIFNGKDLTGWTMKIRHHKTGDNYNNTFRVEDGALKVSFDEYDEFNDTFGHIFYMEKLSNYRLRFEYRFTGEQAKGGPGWAYRNSGVMLHGQHPDTMTLDQKFPISIETQILGGDGEHDRPTANVCSPSTNYVHKSKLVTQHCVNSTSKTYHGDQWVKMEVEVHGGGIIRHIVNSETVFEYEKSQLDPEDNYAKQMIAKGLPLMLTEGYISLQAESHPIEFRNIELLKLNQ